VSVRSGVCVSATGWHGVRVKDDSTDAQGAPLPDDVPQDAAPGPGLDTGLDEGLADLWETHRPPPRLVVCGATDLGAALTEAAALLGWLVTVVDARPDLVDPEQFPGARDVVVAWPHSYLAMQDEQGLLDERTAVCALAHDPTYDVPLLITALQMPLAYVGALGSRTTHDTRVLTLQESGLDDEVLAHLHSPIGLDLGGTTPQETAVAILAEIIAVRSGATGLPLRALDGPVHRDQTD
jgi:xanthine dehydrogenase accessory factor